MLGKKEGSSKGKGGSMHFYNSKEHFYGGNGIVGAQCPVGTGLGFALQFKGNPNKNAAIVMYGDGGADQGQLHEASNMASLWNLPVIYVCENNRYSMGTSVERHSAGGHDFHKKLYNLPGLRFDGMCVYTIKNAIAFAKDYAANHGPIAISIDTYRYHGHSMTDPGITYRESAEVQEVRKTRDPLKLLANHIIDAGFATQEDLKKIDKESKKAVEADVNTARADPLVPEEWLTTDVFEENTKTYLRAPVYEDSVFVKEKLIQ